MPSEIDLKQWIGKKESRQDTIASWPAKGLAATLDEAEPPAGVLPQGWHWIYFLEAKRASEIGLDGLPKRGGFMPPIELPRRMWAGGRVEFLNTIPIGSEAMRESEIISVESKSGRSGNLVFVTVRHTVSVKGQSAIVEEQDIVYRDAAKKGDPLPPGKVAPDGAQWLRHVMPDTVMLFRYSALTFNGHRIHYEKDYAMNEEHYPGLVVHGPLQATLLLELCRHNSKIPVKKFEYRAMSPMFAGAAFTVNGNFDSETSKADLWTANDAGCYAMSATATF